MFDIYEENYKFYLKENNYYRHYDIRIRTNTIILDPTDELVYNLKDYKKYTYKELRDKLLNKKS